MFSRSGGAGEPWDASDVWNMVVLLAGMAAACCVIAALTRRLRIRSILVAKSPAWVKPVVRTVLVEARDQAPTVTFGGGGALVGWALALRTVLAPRPGFWTGWSIAAAALTGVGVILWVYKIVHNALMPKEDPKTELHGLRDEVQALRDEQRAFRAEQGARHRETIEVLGQSGWSRQGQTGTASPIGPVSPPRGNVS